MINFWIVLQFNKFYRKLERFIFYSFPGLGKIYIAPHSLLRNLDTPLFPLTLLLLQGSFFVKNYLRFQSQVIDFFPQPDEKSSSFYGDLPWSENYPMMVFILNHSAII